MTHAARVRSPKVPAEAKKPAGITHDAPEIILKRAVAVLEDYKAQEITVLPLAGMASFADYMVVANGTSSRHVASMGQALKDQLPDHLLGIEGLKEGEWVCADLGSVVVHVFIPAKRALYNLEKLWGHVFAVETE